MPVIQIPVSDNFLFLLEKIEIDRQIFQFFIFNKLCGEKYDYKSYSV